MRSSSENKPISLALQGGGAHGAYTWGVLDALMEDESLPIDGISGTSAGAMNAICVAQGLLNNGREGARAMLRQFWTAIADQSPFQTDTDEVPAALKAILQWTQHFSPAQLNPFDLNPLRDIVEASFDFADLQRHCPIKLFIAATHANTGKLRVFQQRDLSAEALLASACLPTLHRTIVIDGEPYWDGGYSANPAVFPLVYDCTTPDILLILLTPLNFAETPVSAGDIRNRLRELAFNATFLREMRMFAHLKEQIPPSRIPAWISKWISTGQLEQRLATVRFHAIDGEHLLAALPADSKLTVNHAFFDRLFSAGRAEGQRWLAAHHKDIGQRATLDIAKVFY